MAPRTVSLDDASRTIAAIDYVINLNPDRPVLFGGTGSGKTRPQVLPAVEALLGNAVLRGALEDMRTDRDRIASEYAALLTAAQAAVIEARTSHRDPIIPIAEALTGLGALPAAGARLADLPLSTAAAWPRGNED